MKDINCGNPISLSSDFDGISKKGSDGLIGNRIGEEDLI